MERNKTSEIDFVIMWVDGTDPAWLEERRSFFPEDDSSSDIHYRPWETLRYWFRMVEEYTPWVRKVHFVTWGHVPSWLNTSHEKLQIVNHRDFIPSEFLPTYSANSIELNLHRINGLSEKFVFFNDDCFLTRPVKPSFFFSKGLPHDLAALNVHCYKISNPSLLMGVVDTGLINEHFDIATQIRTYKWKWINPKTGKLLLRTIALLKSPRFPGFFQPHVAQPYLKSTFEEVWEKEPDILHETCMHKRREPMDLNHWVMRNWQIAEGNFIPANAKDLKAYFMGRDGAEAAVKGAAKAIRRGKPISICINDSNVDANDFLRFEREIVEAFDEKLGKKSSFEL